MSNALRAIKSELKRLQQEGLDRVFIDDSTLSLLQNQAADTKRASATSVSAELKALIGTSEQSGSTTTGTPAAPKSAPTTAAKLPSPPVINLPEGDADFQMHWLHEQMSACPVCKEQMGETGKLVFGTGKLNAEILFCGEAPGVDETAAGEPFAGKAGQLLNKIIQAMGLSRDQVYLSNLVKWRPQHEKPYGNRPPNAEEMAFCRPYLEAEIKIVQPKLVVALGHHAVSGLLGPDPDRRLDELRGTWHEFLNTSLLVTFHPSYLLRNDTLKTKRLVWEDMLQVMERLSLPISEKQRGFFLPKK